jgi:hypothetical protein
MDFILGNVDAERVLFSHLLECYLAFAPENPVEKNLGCAGVRSGFEQSGGVWSRAHGAKTFKKKRLDRKPLALKVSTIEAANLLDPKREYLFTGLEEYKDKINAFRPWLESLAKR